MDFEILQRFKSFSWENFEKTIKKYFPKSTFSSIINLFRSRFFKSNVLEYNKNSSMSEKQNIDNKDNSIGNLNSCIDKLESNSHNLSDQTSSDFIVNELEQNMSEEKNSLFSEENQSLLKETSKPYDELTKVNTSSVINENFSSCDNRQFENINLVKKFYRDYRQKNSKTLS